MYAIRSYYANVFIGLVIDEALGDRIKVTAIATGFGESFDAKRPGARESVRPTLSAIAGSGPVNAGDVEVPTFIRQQREGNRTRAASPGLAEGSDYEVPAFLRRRVD